MGDSQGRGAIRSSYRIKLLLFFFCAVAVLLAVNVGYSALNTLSRLDIVEAERDRWQRPADVIQALSVTHGDKVVDLGCGSGYFALKLSSAVGEKGRVIAEDIRRLPLVFLWIRTVMKGTHNVQVLHGQVDDPHLPSRGVKAVLIANTYHEFTDSRSILVHLSQSLVAGGKLVVVDRAPRAVDTGNVEAGDHEIAAEKVESELRQANFTIVTRQDHFIEDDPDHEVWWLIVARNP